MGQIVNQGAAGRTVSNRETRRGGGFARVIRRLLLLLLILLVPAPIATLLVFRVLPVPFTPQMAIDLVTLNPVHYSWREGSGLSPYLARAAIAAEDDNFCRHHGFDFKAMHDAWRDYTLRGKPLRGASTLSQQTARELFLTPWRSVVRKAVEAWLTLEIEALWPKSRIMTVYLNVVDWGHGNFGAEAAAQAYLHTSAARLTPAQAARLVAILPNPDRWKADHPGRYVRRRTGTLVGRGRQVTNAGLDWCVR